MSYLPDFMAVTLYPVAPSGMKTTLSTPAHWVVPLLDYVDWQRAGSAPATTIKLRTYHLKRFGHAAARHPFEVTIDDLVSHLSRRTWAPGTRRSVRTTLRSFYAWAHATGRMTTNPAAGLPQITVPPGKPRPASDRAVDRGLSDVDERVRLMVKLGAKAGLRCCEIALVATRDVVGEPGRFSLLVHGKGNKERYVPISDDLARELLVRPEGWTFPGLIDGHLSAGYVSKLISGAMAGLSTAHPLRHRYATRTLRASGGNLRVVQELLGHASVATTQIYTLVEDDELRAAALAA